MNSNTIHKRILFTGGGTGGSVTPLLAVFEEFAECGNDFEFRWIGTRTGPEKTLLKKYSIPFFMFPAAKLRRYFSWRTFLEPIIFLYACVKSIFFLLTWRPHVIISAGSFVSVPIVVMGKVLGIRSLIHQLDVLPTLSNKLMAPFAARITITFPEQVDDFKHYKKKTVVTGNPVRQRIGNPSFVKTSAGRQESGIKAKTQELFNLGVHIPTLLVVGGGTGSKQINELVWSVLDTLTEFCQVIHITGKGKDTKAQEHENKKTQNRYYSFEFLTDELPQLLSLADVVVTRAGMSFLSELSVLGKPTIIIPLPHSHQEKNAAYYKQRNAAIVLDYEHYLSEKDKKTFIQEIKNIVINDEKRKILSRNISSIIPKDAAKRVAREITLLINRPVP